MKSGGTNLEVRETLKHPQSSQNILEDQLVCHYVRLGFGFGKFHIGGPFDRALYLGSSALFYKCNIP